MLHKYACFHTQTDAEKGSDRSQLATFRANLEEFARKYKTSWAKEVARYLIHGILHLRGYDDSAPELRRTMKREENRLMTAAAGRCRWC